MVVEFKSADGVEMEVTGFSATIHYNSYSELCMGMDEHILQSPNYPSSYGDNILCNRLIIVQHGFYIKLEFLEFNVCVMFILKLWYINTGSPCAE